MYETYYSFTGSPFQLTPDPRFFYGSRGHSRAIAHLTYGLAQGEGFIIVTGEVGAGKTTLIERLLSTLDHDTYAVARVNTTQVSGDDLFRLAMAGFGMNEADTSKATLLLRFEACIARPPRRRPPLPADRGRGAEPFAVRAGGTAHAL